MIRDMFELLPCPFCGGRADILLDENKIGVIIQCENCRNQTRTYKNVCGSIKHPLIWAIDNWNQRIEAKVKEKEN